MMKKIVGRVESLWRYPVKSMRGEQLPEAYLGFYGLQGDRLYAFQYSRAPQHFPYLTSREQPEMLMYRASYHGVPSHHHSVSVETPQNQEIAVDSPLLIQLLSQKIRPGENVSLLASDRAMTDAHPISLFSIQTPRQLGTELGISIDKRRFRANIYIDLYSGTGFAEDELVGEQLLIGRNASIQVIERDERCKMITLDPETTLANPNIMRQVAHSHEGRAGIYGSVVAEGVIRVDDEIAVVTV